MHFYRSVVNKMCVTRKCENWGIWRGSERKSWGKWVCPPTWLGWLLATPVCVCVCVCVCARACVRACDTWRVCATIDCNDSLRCGCSAGWQRHQCMWTSQLLQTGSIWATIYDSACANEDMTNCQIIVSYLELHIVIFYHNALVEIRKKVHALIWLKQRKRKNRFKI